MVQALIIACRRCGTTKESDALAFTCWRCVFALTTGAERTPKAEPVRPERVCLRCGRPLASRHARARFCSAACQKASRRADVRQNPAPAPSPHGETQTPSSLNPCQRKRQETTYLEATDA